MIVIVAPVRWRRTGAVAVLLGSAALALSPAVGLLSGSALGLSIYGPVGVELDGKTSRTRFPALTPMPTFMTLEGKFSEAAGTGARVPAVRTISLQFDKAGAIFTKGLPTCRWPPPDDLRLEYSRPQRLPQRAYCESSLVGHG